MVSPAPESSTLSVLEAELSTIPPLTEQSTRSTSPQLPSSTVKRSRTSFVWKHMPGPVNTIYTRGQRVYWRCKYCPREYRESGETSVVDSFQKSLPVRFRLI